MKQFHLILTVVLAIAATAADLAAQAPWNRRVIHIAEVDHGDGSSTLHAVLQTMMYAPQSTPTDLSMNVDFFIEGTRVGAQTVQQIVDPGSGACAAGCFASCGTSTWGAMSCLLESFGGPCVCTASTLASLKIPTSALSAGDTVLVRLSPALGSVAELETSDDELSLGNLGGPGSDGIYRRDITAVKFKPASTGQGFQVETEIHLDSPDLAIDPHFITLDSIYYDFQGSGPVSQEFVPGTGFGDKLIIIITDGMPYPSAPESETLVVQLEAAPGSFPPLPGIDEPLEEFQIPMPTLLADLDELSASAGGTQTLELRAGTARAGDLYLLAGSLSGTSPGLTFDGLNLPLNPDAYFLFSLQVAGQPPYANSVGFLDATGAATASFTLPPSSAASLAGLQLHHAYGTLDPATGLVSLTSNAVPLDFLP